MSEDWKHVLWVNAKDKDTLLAQYTAYAETTAHVSNSRIAANTLHLSLAALLLGAFAFLMDRDPVPRTLVTVAWLSGLVLAFQWWAIVMQYKKLNGVKFAVLDEMAQHLAARPFQAEWLLLEEGRRRKLYWPVTHIEQYLPLVIAAAETMMAVYLLAS